MEALITEAPVHLIQANEEDEYKFLGVCLWAHLQCLLHASIFNAEVMSHRPLTLKYLSNVFDPNYEARILGKAFEYAVAELFNRKMEPCWSKIHDGLQIAIQKLVRKKVAQKSLGDSDQILCVRVAIDVRGVERLTDLQSFKLIQKANTGIGGALRNDDTVRRKVDAVFCERHSDQPHDRFGALASFKSNPEDFWPGKFAYNEIDIGITLSTHDFKDVAMWRDDISRPVVYLEMCIDPRIHGWKSASHLVFSALQTGERRRFFDRISRLWYALIGREPFDKWIDFLAYELETELPELVEKVEKQLSGKPAQRTILVPTIGAGVVDYCIDDAN
jgi:hypothetical protein